MRLAFEVDTEKNSEVMEDISLAKKKSASRLVANGTFVQGLSLSNLHFLFDGVRNPKIEEGIVKKSSSKCSLVGRRSCRKRANFNGVWKKSCSRPMGRYRTWRWAETAGWHWVTLLLRVLCRYRWSKPNKPNSFNSPSLVKMQKWQKLPKIFGRRMQSCTSVWRSCWLHVVTLC